MPNSFLIYCMSKKFQLVFIPLSFLLCLGLYYPSLNGAPIWDDINFWFQDPALQTGASTIHILKNYAWPVSVGLQKFLLGLFHENYILYHLLGLVLHSANALMVLKLANKLNARFANWIYLIFLLHPSNVITVAWMIQLKTILCFSFAIGSILLLLKAQEKHSFYIPSWLLFGASVFSKSASLPVFAIITFFSFKEIKTKKALLLIPYLVFTLWGSARLLRSAVTQEAFHHSEIQREEEEVDKPLINLSLMAKSLSYYFWQPILPVENAPVKGMNKNSVGIPEVIHLGFLLVLCILTFKQRSFLYLLSAHILLIPFLGILPAPYMNVTWVSDQHLYLALPAFLFFWFSLLEKTSNKYIHFLPSLFLAFFVTQTARSTPFYKNEISFYEESLRYNPVNVPLSYNLAVSYIQANKLDEALNLVNTVLYMGLADETVKNDQYFPEIMRLQFKLQGLNK